MLQWSSHSHFIIITNYFRSKTFIIKFIFNYNYSFRVPSTAAAAATMIKKSLFIYYGLYMSPPDQPQRANKNHPTKKMGLKAVFEPSTRG